MIELLRSFGTLGDGLNAFCIEMAMSVMLWFGYNVFPPKAHIL
jgi:hypothetical protein